MLLRYYRPYIHYKLNFFIHEPTRCQTLCFPMQNDAEIDVQKVGITFQLLSSFHVNCKQSQGYFYTP